MKITIFTSNQPRHLAFIKKLSKISDEVHAIIEVNTVFPGSNTDFFKKSDIMQKYFHNVLSAEKKIFGNIDFLPQNVSSLILKLGSLCKTELQSTLHSSSILQYLLSIIHLLYSSDIVSVFILTPNILIELIFIIFLSLP